MVLDEVRKRLSSPEQIRYLLDKVENEISNLSSDIPESTQRNESELGAEERRLRNYIDFIGEGKGSRILNEVLLKSEKKIDTLQTEIDGLRQTRDKVFQTPPIEWIEETLSQFRELLEVNNNDTALVLRNLLGPVKLETKFQNIGSLTTSPILQ